VLKKERDSQIDSVRAALSAEQPNLSRANAQTVRVRYMNDVDVIPPASSFYANATSTYSALDEGSGTGNPSSRIASI
jgi:hypothetical protein